MIETSAGIETQSGDLLAAHARETPDRDALRVIGGRTLTYAALDRRADRLAAWLARQGLCPGDTIGLLGDNDALTVELWWAARRAGLYYVPIGTRLRAAEITFIVQDCSARMLIAAPSLLGLAQEVRAACAGAGPDLWATTADTPEGWLTVEGVDAPAPAPDAFGREIIYSSGTTGRPKGIRRARVPAAAIRTIPEYEERLRTACGLDERTIYLSVAPLYHATGRFVMRVIEEGGTAVVLPAFDPLKALRALAEYRITHSQWVPTMFSRLLDLPEAERRAHDLSAHRVALHAAAPCSTPLKRAMIAWWGPILNEYYGGSENAGVTFISTPEWLDRPGSVGRSITGAIHILDENDSARTLPEGEIGLICFEGGVPFSYINEPPEDVAARAGPLASYGDLGHLDPQGYLFISDRRTDLINRGGVNIYPREIELVLERHPMVAEAAVIGISDGDAGQAAKAIIRATAPITDEATAEQALIAHCRANMAAIKCPVSVAFVDALPRNDNGKLLKRELRAAHEALNDRPSNIRTDSPGHVTAMRNEARYRR